MEQLLRPRAMLSQLWGKMKSPKWAKNGFTSHAKSGWIFYFALLLPPSPQPHLEGSACMLLTHFSKSCCEEGGVRDGLRRLGQKKRIKNLEKGLTERQSGLKKDQKLFYPLRRFRNSIHPLYWPWAENITKTIRLCQVFTPGFNSQL